MDKRLKQRLSYLTNYFLDWLEELNDDDKDRLKNFRLIEGGLSAGTVVPFPDALQLNKAKSNVNHNSLQEEVMIYKKRKVERLKGRYRIRYYHNKKQHAVYGKTQKLCCQAYDEALKQVKKEKPTNKIKLGDFLELWFELFRKGKRAPATLKHNKNNIETIKNSSIGKMNLADLDIIELQKYLNSIFGDRQREHIFTVLNMAFKKAVVLKYLNENPLQVIEIKKYEAPERYILNSLEVKTFIKKIQRNVYRDYFLILLYQALRPGELAALKPIHIKHEHITVRNAVDELGNVKSTKTNSGRRNIPIFPEAAQALKNFKPLSVSLDDLRDELKIIAKEMQLPESFQLYNLRHTCITRWAQKGVHTKVAQKWAGHKTLEITLKYYTHVNTEWELSELEKMNEKKD